MTEKIKEIPQWMEKLIPTLSGGAYKTKSELLSDEKENLHFNPERVRAINSRIDMLISLKQQGFLNENGSSTGMRYIDEVKIGEIFKIYPDQEYYYVLQSTEILGDRIWVREFRGGKGNGMASAWLGEPMECHADIEVLVVEKPSEKLLK